MANIMSAFTEDQAIRLTGVSRTQIRYWNKTDFFKPSQAFGPGPSDSLFSFRDLACLKVLNSLRNDAGVSLQELRAAKEKLAPMGEDLWAKTVLYVLRKKVVFHNPETAEHEEVVSGQGVLQVPLRVVSEGLTDAIHLMRKRDAGQVGQVSKARTVLGNQALIAGTRIPVRSIKAFADAGYSIQQIQAEYPQLTADDVRAAIAYTQAA